MKQCTRCGQDRNDLDNVSNALSFFVCVECRGDVMEFAKETNDHREQSKDVIMATLDVVPENN